MQKLYTEEQYKEYYNLMLKMYNAMYTIEQNNTYNKVKDWLYDNNIDDDIEMQMLQRITQECDNAIDNEKQECKIIQFPR